MKIHTEYNGGDYDDDSFDNDDKISCNGQFNDKESNDVNQDITIKINDDEDLTFFRYETGNDITMCVLYLIAIISNEEIFGYLVDFA